MEERVSFWLPPAGGCSARPVGRPDAPVVDRLHAKIHQVFLTKRARCSSPGLQVADVGVRTLTSTRLGRYRMMVSGGISLAVEAELLEKLPSPQALPIAKFSKRYALLGIFTPELVFTRRN